VLDRTRRLSCGPGRDDEHEIQLDHIAIAAHRVADVPAVLGGVLGGWPTGAVEFASTRPVTPPETPHPAPGTVFRRGVA
jgi:hypothetical protein